MSLGCARLNGAAILHIGATHGNGLLIAQQLLQGGSSARVIARDPDKAIRLLGNRVNVAATSISAACPRVAAAINAKKHKKAEHRDICLLVRLARHRAGINYSFHLDPSGSVLLARWQSAVAFLASGCSDVEITGIRGSLQKEVPWCGGPSLMSVLGLAV